MSTDATGPIKRSQVQLLELHIYNLEDERDSLRAHIEHLRAAAQRLIDVSRFDHVADCHCAYCELRHAIAVTGGPK